MLKRFVHNGLVEECDADMERRRCYRLTRRGRRLMTEEADRLAALVRVSSRGVLIGVVIGAGQRSASSWPL